jgi:benzoate-CoA ligase family protein
MSAPTFPDDFNLASYFLFDRLRDGGRNRAALLFGDRQQTYQEVADHTRALRAYLAFAGLSREERVLILLHDTPAFVWAFFATLYHGAVVALGNPDAPPPDIAYLVEYTRARVVFTTPRVAHSIAPVLSAAKLRTLVLVPEVQTGGDVTEDLPIPPSVAHLRRISLGNAIALGRTYQDAGSPPPSSIKRDDVAIWLFTSGSTGKPKAAIHTHRDFAFNTEVYAKGCMGYRQGDITVSVPRLFFGYATGTNLMFPFAVGATTALFAERPTPETLSAAIERYKPTIVTNVPTMMGKLLEADEARAAAGKPRFDFSSVRFYLSAGEALPPALLDRFVRRFKSDVYDGIGSAEMFHIYCTNRPGDIKPGSLGRVVHGYTIKILPPSAEGPGAPELPRGETGVMWVKGDSVATGYFQDRDKSWATFFGHWCRTGDLFRMDEEGYLWFSGRSDELLKVSGIFVAPTEVEECLLHHPAVSIAAVIGTEDRGLIKPKAFVVVREGDRDLIATEAGRQALATELKDHVKTALSRHKYPRFIVFIDDLPKNDRGKVDRRALRDREVQGKNPVGY